MAKRPGVMVYFDLRDSLQYYSNEEVGQIFRAVLDYGSTGVLPEFSDRAMKTLWNSIQSKLDRDGEKYEKTVRGREYGAYCLHADRRGEERLSRDDWERTKREATSWHL